MADLEKKVWGIHAVDDNLFLKRNRIAIGWRDMGDLTKIENSRDAFREKLVRGYPNTKKGAVPVATGMLYRFCHEVKPGDYVVFPSKADRMINIGEVTGEYIYDPSEYYAHMHDVKWLKHLTRTSFT